jgi:tRNA-splicing ligase RtcB (3'-phosphate/5'-hydroxy nucleic acid ligase)
MNGTLYPNTFAWLAAPMPNNVRQSIQRLSQVDDVQHIAVMPDIHLSGEVCVGVALATREKIFPAAVGADIGCGMLAIRFDAQADLLRKEQNAAHLMHELYQHVPTLKQRRETAPLDLPRSLKDLPLSDTSLQKLTHRDGRMQLGTLGRGNHFVEFQSDEQDRLWLMLHSGSRGMGQAITTHHLRQSPQQRPKAKLISFAADSPAGIAYLMDLAWAVRYAEENRLAMLNAIARIMVSLFGIETLPASQIHANHNHVRQEQHEGQSLWIHRKGALPAAEGEAGLIPGSMGTCSFHVTGRGCPAALHSSSHGAGRRLSRTEAAAKISSRQFDRELKGVWFDQSRAAQLRDEAPSAYKDIRAVMKAQRDLTCIDRELRPILSYKGV